MSEPLPYRPFGAFRFALASIVMLGHGAWIAEGFWLADALAASRAASAGVIAFFVLSGFILSEAADKIYRDRVAAFAANRFLKIYPPFIAAFALSLAVHGVLTGGDLFEAAYRFEGAPPHDIWDLRNVFWNPLSIIPFLRPDDVAANSVPEPYLFVRYVWAINVEMLFYAAVAGAILMRKNLGKWAPAILAAVLLILNLAPSSEWDAYQYIRHAPFFALGFAMYGVGRWGMTPAHSFLLLVSSGLATSNGYMFIGTVSGTILLASFVLILFLLSSVRRTSKKAFDAELGDLSYAIYLNHYVVLLICSASDVSGPIGWLAAFTATILLSIALNRLTERPLKGIRAKLRGEPKIGGV